MPARAHFVCTFEGCGKRHEAKGLCSGHYIQQRGGRPLTPLQEPRPRHGHSKDPLFTRWCSIKDRTSNPASSDYHNYGGRGIRLHAPWAASFAAFRDGINSTIGPRPGTGREYHLDRADNSGHYEPGNLRWSTPAENCRNKRTVRTMQREIDALRAELEAYRAGA